MKERAIANPTAAKKKIDEARQILKTLDLPKAQQNERSALSLLAILGLRPESDWNTANAQLIGITPMMEFMAVHYGKIYAPNSRETVRRQTVHQFLGAGLIIENPDKPERPTNSGQTAYQIESSTLELLRTYSSEEWSQNLGAYLSSVETLKSKYSQERQLIRIPVRINGQDVTLSAGGQNVLIKEVLEKFGSIFTPGGDVLFVGDTDSKFVYFDSKALADLGVRLGTHGKLPDVIIHRKDKNWLILVEAVTSHGPVDPKRRSELVSVFKGSSAPCVYVTAFLDRRTMTNYLSSIAWETEVWVASDPTHLIHFNGERFLGPY